jgi:hypothetical protein
MIAVPDHVTHIAAMHIIFTHIGCTLLTRDMYMCRLSHIHDPVLLSLKMEGMRLLFVYRNQPSFAFQVILFLKMSKHAVALAAYVSICIV